MSLYGFRLLSYKLFWFAIYWHIQNYDYYTNNIYDQTVLGAKKKLITKSCKCKNFVKIYKS